MSQFLLVQLATALWFFSLTITASKYLNPNLRSVIILRLGFRRTCGAVVEVTAMGQESSKNSSDGTSCCCSDTRTLPFRSLSWGIGPALPSPNLHMVEYTSHRSFRHATLSASSANLQCYLQIFYEHYALNLLPDMTRERD